MNNKIIVQSDFDGTITTEDQSFHILDKFTDGSWRKYKEYYRRGEISVGRFNTLIFGMVSATRQEMVGPGAEYRSHPTWVQRTA